MAVIYFIGALSVILYNAGNILPSIGAILGDIFSGSAAGGGFLGARWPYAFNRGVNRGLFSNEAGQGSAPIAHASAKAHEPVLKEWWLFSNHSLTPLSSVHLQVLPYSLQAYGTRSI